MSDTGCECDRPTGEAFTFFCARHRCQKTRRWWELCRTRADYFRAWEEGRGPGQKPPPPTQDPPIASRANDTPARAQARKLACQQCPEGHWDAVQGFCPMIAARRCLMRSHLNGPRRVCKHWPE
jgi:hypothetical protein